MIRQLLSPEYWVVAEPGPLGRLWVIYAALGVFFAVGSSLAAWVALGRERGRSTGTGRALAYFELGVCLTGLVAVAGRILGWPGWSARIWSFCLGGLALAGALAYRLREVSLPAWMVGQAQVLCFAPASPPDELPGGRRRGAVQLALGLLVHLLGIALYVYGRFGLPVWVAPLAFLGLMIPQAPLLVRGRRPSIMALAPLLVLYGATLLWLLYDRLGITVIAWQGLVFPNPMTSLFYVDGIAFACVVYALLCQGVMTCTSLHHSDRAWRWAVAGLLVATVAWSSAVYLGKRTRGATGSDPYAYAQMAADLVERGTFQHRFALFQEAGALGIAWAPLLPVGYHIPRNELGDSPSVWATGASVLLAAGYGLLGEAGLYATTPVVALLALAATWAFAQEALRREPLGVRYLAAALAVTLTATSPEQVDRLLVPMADAPAQIFTVLTLLFALKAMRQLETGQRRAAVSIALAGFTFGWAYWVRHTQIVLCLPVLVAVALGLRKSPDRSRAALLLVAVFLGAALVAAFPDIVYRWRTFGSFLAAETTELPAMRFRYVPAMAWEIGRASLVAGEWGYLFPFAVIGAHRLARRHGSAATVIGSALFAVLLVHLTYRFLRLRDLISLFPLVNLAVALGAVSAVRWASSTARDAAIMRKLGASLAGISLTAWVVVSLALSRWAMIDDLFKPGWASFGYMSADQRAALDRLADLTTPRAVIGASLNAGAVMMYSGRDAIRPYDGWTDEEWTAFLHSMQADARPVYLLDDGSLMGRFISQQRTQSRLTPIEWLPVPVFGDDETAGWLFRVEAQR